MDKYRLIVFNKNIFQENAIENILDVLIIGKFSSDKKIKRNHPYSCAKPKRFVSEVFFELTPVDAI